MIEIYLKSNTNYKGNGNITLDPTSCIYKDSEKELTLEHFLDEEGRWKYIDFENVIAAEENGKKKLYRIYNVVRSLYSVTAYARPIFYDLADKVLLDVRPTDKIAEEALNIILDGTGFKGHSNLTSINTSYYVRKNIVEALIGDIQNSFLNRWGGEFYCENFDVYINDRIGSDNGVRVEFGYNLNEIEEDINIDEVVTRIIPVGYNGITLDGDSPWVDSKLINKYTHIKARVIEFSDIKVKDESSGEEGFETIEEARAELIRQCSLLFEGGIDKPTVNYKIDMINLANTTEYEKFKMLVNVNKGDTVTCYIAHLGIDVQARVIDYEKDLLTGEYISIELGSATNDFFKNQSDIQNKVESIFNENGNVKAETLEGAINALQTKFKALRDIAQPQSVRAILFEDRVEDSPTFGCMCLGTMGFEIASKFKPGTQDWDFRTFGTGQGFVADYIVTGVLNAALIKAGILESENGKTWINMEDGTFNFIDRIKYDGTNFEIGNDDSSVLITDNLLKVKNGNVEIWNKDNTKKMIYLGSDGNAIFGGDIKMELESNPNKYIAFKAVPYEDEIGCKLVLGGSTLNNSFSIEDPNTVRYFWVNRNGTYVSNNLYIISDQKAGNPLATDVALDDGLIYPVYNNKGKLGTKTNKWQEINATTASFYNAEILNILYTKDINTNNSNINMGIGSLIAGSAIINGNFSSGDIKVGDINCDYIYGNRIFIGSDFVINSSGQLNANYLGSYGNIAALGNLTVSGSKNSLQSTENYGHRLINAYETAEYYFGDIGNGVIKSGECIVYIDDILKECINTECEYHVFTQVYKGNIVRIERLQNYFIVYGEEETEFSWEIKAKRRGYENVRLDTVEIEIEKDIPHFNDFESETSEEVLLQELTFDLEKVLLEGLM